MSLLSWMFSQRHLNWFFCLSCTSWDQIDSKVLPLSEASVCTSHGLANLVYRCSHSGPCRWHFLPVLLCILAMSKAPPARCPSRPLCLFVCAVASIPGLPLVVFWLGCSPFSSSPCLPKICLFRAQLRFSHLPSWPCPSPTNVIGSCHSTLIALNNINQKFWNFQQSGIVSIWCLVFSRTLSY